MPMTGALHQPTAQIEDDIAVGGVATNPTAADVLATTGQLDTASYVIQVNGHGDVDTYFEIAKRNAANSADLWKYELPVPADIDIPFIFAGTLSFAKNERLVVRARDSETGDVQAMIKFDKVTG